MAENNKHSHKIELSAVLTIAAIVALYSLAIVVVIISPIFVDPSWVNPSSHFQVQMYEVSDPRTYISRVASGAADIEYVNHLEEGITLHAYRENEGVRIIAPENLEKYITRLDGEELKLTSRLLLLRKPIDGEAFQAATAAEDLQIQLQSSWEKEYPDWKDRGLQRVDYSIYELFDPEKKEAFTLGRTGGFVENYVDENFVLLEAPSAPYHNDSGVIYISNPEEYRVRRSLFGSENRYRYDPKGEPIKDIEELTGEKLGFTSRKDLIALGEHVFAIEGCWYCHTDQSRTLIQDSVLNGSESFAAPPSSGNEYIYQKISFPGTRRIGPDLARVGVKKPSRDWHKSHFWEPKTESPGSIMPSFRHFFDDDPRGQMHTVIGVPNKNFEAVFQYLMTKGTRITPPTQAWWLGKDPLHTTEIIEGKRVPSKGQTSHDGT